MNTIIAEYRKNLEREKFTKLNADQFDGPFSADDINRIIESVGGVPVAYSQPSPGEDGSNVILTNTYLILLLVDRIAALEEKLS